MTDHRGLFPADQADRSDNWRKGVWEILVGRKIIACSIRNLANYDLLGGRSGVEALNQGDHAFVEKGWLAHFTCFGRHS